MHKTILLTALLGGALQVSAQITLNSSHMPSAGVSFTTDQVDAEFVGSLNLGNAGANQNWDFSNAPTVNELQYAYYLSPAQTPYADQFPTANLAFTDELSDTAYYNYLNLTNTAFTQLGAASGADVITYSPAFKGLVLPFTYQNNFTHTSQVSGSTEEIPVTGSYSTSVVADAYGTVKTELGTFSCLRIKRISELNLTVFLFNVIQRDTIYEWWTTQYKAPVFTYSDFSSEVLGEVSSGSYATVLTEQAVPVREPGAARLHLDAAPNPVQDATRLSFTTVSTGKTDLTVVDMYGKTVAQYSLGQLSPGAYTQTVDLSAAPAGAYAAMLRQNGRLVAVQQLVKS